jgi:hypothetical protein
MQNHHFEDSAEHSSVDFELIAMHSMLGKAMEIERTLVGTGVADFVADRSFGQ